MPGHNEDRDRQVVPRWRSFVSTIRHGEVSPLRSHLSSPFTDEMVAATQEDWKQKPGVAVAADFVSVALTLGRREVARDAAEFILANAEELPLAKSVAASYLSNEDPFTNDRKQDLPPPFVPTELRSEIHAVRHRLHLHPQNPILWANLARLYTSLGVQEKATRAIEVAVALAKDNRFILRAASRLYLHQGDPSKAHATLIGASRIKNDPWILSAEIATAAADNKTSHFVKTARKLIESGEHSLFHLSELASALGTLEAKSGNLKSARRLIKLSLECPTENSRAQAAWLARNVGGFEQTPSPETGSFEANAWSAEQREDWKKALDEADKWRNDQPFSSRPAIFGSYVASIIEDFDRAVTFAQNGLLSNPDDFTLYNNLAFSLAQQGRIEEAAKALQNIDGSSLNKRKQLVLQATKGFIAFRSGDPETGRSLYYSAIAMAQLLRDPKEFVAKAFLAVEEIRIGGPFAEQLREEVTNAATRVNDPVLKVLVHRLKSLRPNPSPATQSATTSLSRTS